MDKDIERGLADFGEFLLRERIVHSAHAPFHVKWVRRFLERDEPQAGEALQDRVQRFCEELERAAWATDWMVKQAEQAIRLYFLNFLKVTDWRKPERLAQVQDAEGQVNPEAALAQLRETLRLKHYSYRTEKTYADWVRRFFEYLGEAENGRRRRARDPLGGRR